MRGCKPLHKISGSVFPQPRPHVNGILNVCLKIFVKRDPENGFKYLTIWLNIIPRKCDHNDCDKIAPRTNAVIHPNKNS